MKRLRSVLVIDDERGFGEMLRALLEGEGYRVTYESAADTALVRLGRETYDLVLCDITMPRMTGQDFLRAFSERGHAATVIMMSAYGTVDTAIECMKLGAYDYISKPFQTDELILTLKKVEEREGLRSENKRLKRQLDGRKKMVDLVGESPVIQRLSTAIAKVAEYKTTVLITGESGTGKEVVARVLHQASPRADKPFVPLNCGAIAETLLESELFGTVPGAFTGARDKRGMFEEAKGGSLFLDEIGELPLHLQVKLLRAIDEEEIRRVGATRPTRTDARIIAATNRDLKQDVEAGRFREDLFHRLNIVALTLPPLRARIEDVPLLAEHFVRRASGRLGKTMTGIEPEAMRLLTRYHWPGNVRELENTIERACVFAEGQTITKDVLPDAVANASDRVRLALSGGELSIKKTTRVVEEELITRALTQTEGNRTRAAKLLEISHRALLYKIKEYGIDIPPR